MVPVNFDFRDPSRPGGVPPRRLNGRFVEVQRFSCGLIVPYHALEPEERDRTRPPGHPVTQMEGWSEDRKHTFFFRSSTGAGKLDFVRRAVASSITSSPTIVLPSGSLRNSVTEKNLCDAKGAGQPGRAGLVSGWRCRHGAGRNGGTPLAAIKRLKHSGGKIWSGIAAARKNGRVPPSAQRGYGWPKFSRALRLFRAWQFARCA